MDARNVLRTISQVGNGDTHSPVGMIAILYKMAEKPSEKYSPEEAARYLGVTNQTAWSYFRRLKNNNWIYRGRLTRKACSVMGLELYSAEERSDGSDQFDPPDGF